MKKDLHPNYPEITVTCSCGNSVLRPSQPWQKIQILKFVLNAILFILVSRKYLDTAGRVEKFKQKYGM